jgi:hypothetical protein
VLDGVGGRLTQGQLQVLGGELAQAAGGGPGGHGAPQGGEPPRFGRDGEPQRRGQHADGDERDVVGLVGLGEHVVQQAGGQAVGVRTGQGAGQLAQPSQSGVEVLPAALDEAVGVEQQRVAGRQEPLVVGAGRTRTLGSQHAAPTADWSTVGRNDPCPCGSGKKFKKCHGASL